MLFAPFITPLCPLKHRARLSGVLFSHFGKVIPDLTTKFDLRADAAIYDEAVEALYEVAFGPGRHAKAAARLREGNFCRRDVSFVALKDAQLVGACRLWPLKTDQGGQALFLGPIAVAPAQQGQGLGGTLLATCLAACDRLTGLAVILVGDLDFFEPYGFIQVPKGQLVLPGPADPRRFLYRPAPSNQEVAPKGRLSIQSFGKDESILGRAETIRPSRHQHHRARTASNTA